MAANPVIGRQGQGDTAMKTFQLSLAVWALAAASGALAGDGQTDILPSGAATFTIASPGSYVLVQDVTMTDNSVPCITVSADNVKIDLNGHTIAGIGGTGDGIQFTGSRKGCQVRNGTVTAFGEGGVINIGAQAVVSDLEVSSCGGAGVEAGTGARIQNVTAQGNGSYGIFGGSRSLVQRGISTENCTQADSAAGIQVGFASIVEGCSSTYNVPILPVAGVTSIEAGSGSSIIGNLLAENTATGGSTCIGIQAGGYSTVTGNSVLDHFSQVAGITIGIDTGVSCVITKNVAGRCVVGEGGTVYGIKTNGYCVIESNQCDFNHVNAANGSAYGIFADDYSRVSGNSCTDSRSAGTGAARGIAVNNSCTVERNHCSTNTTGASAYGIFVSGTDNIIRENTTMQNGTAGIRLGAGSNRCESNRSAEGAISDIGGNSIGAGDLANVSF